MEVVNNCYKIPGIMYKHPVHIWVGLFTAIEATRYQNYKHVVLVPVVKPGL